jgi:hypothetical protein
MNFKLLGIISKNTKKQKAIKIPAKIEQALKEAAGLQIAAEEVDTSTGFNSVQYYINSLDWQIRGMFNKESVMSYKCNDSELVLTLSSGHRIRITSTNLREHQRYEIWLGKEKLVDAIAKPARFQPGKEPKNFNNNQNKKV